MRQQHDEHLPTRLNCPLDIGSHHGSAFEVIGAKLPAARIDELWDDESRFVEVLALRSNNLDR